MTSDWLAQGLRICGEEPYHHLVDTANAIPDPAEDSWHLGVHWSMQSHVFTNQWPEILKMMRDLMSWATRKSRAQLLREARHGREIKVGFWCRSGRHRSTCCLVIFACMLMLCGAKVRSVHRCRHWWQFSKCHKYMSPKWSGCAKCGVIIGEGYGLGVSGVVGFPKFLYFPNFPNSPSSQIFPVF